MENRFNERFVRILGSDGVPRGCGFAITPNLIVTCAHVVTAAVPAPAKETPIPTGWISFDLPLHEQVLSASARVVSWFPVAEASGAVVPIEDIAVLETEEVLPLADDLTVIDIQGSTPNIHFSVYGYPDEDPRGANAYGVIRDAIAGGWTQLDQDGTGVIIQPGFSGGPVWSSDFDGVIGMVVSYDHRENLRRSTMISARLLAEVIPELRTRLRVERVHMRARDSEPPALLVHLCDREPQERALRLWQTRRDRTKPSVFVVEGPDLECHAGFVERLAGDLLPRALSIRSGTIPVLELDWPTTSLKDGVLDSQSHVALEWELENSPQFHSTAPLLVSSFALSREWRDGGRAAINQFAQFWSRTRLDQPRDLFVCIGVRYSETTSRMPWFNRVARGARLAREAVEHMRTSYPTFLVFPTLEPVLRSVVLSWAKDARVRQWSHLSNERIINAFERIPRQNWRGGGVPMNYLAEELTALLRMS